MVAAMLSLVVLLVVVVVSVPVVGVVSQLVRWSMVASVPVALTGVAVLAWSGSVVVVPGVGGNGISWGGQAAAAGQQ